MFFRWRFKPKILRDVSKVDTTVKIDDQIYKTPIFVAPTAICKWACSDGELAAAQGGLMMHIEPIVKYSLIRPLVDFISQVF